MIIMLFIFIIGFVIGHFFGQTEATAKKTIPTNAAERQTKKRIIEKDCIHIPETNTYIWKDL